MTDRHSDPWLEWLSLAEWDRLTIGIERTAHWPSILVKDFERAGLLLPDVPREFMTCPECRDGACEVVHFEHPHTGQSMVVVPCPECGVTEIPAADLRCWCVNWSALPPVIADGFGLRGTPQEIVRNRLWQLGRAFVGGRPTTLLLGRAFHRRDTPETVAPIAGFRNAVIVVPKRMPTVPLPHPVATLDLMMTWTTDEWDFDPTILEELVPASPLPERKRPPKKEGQRAAVRERIKAELQAHISASRSHVQAALDHGRTPTLLPFPSYQELARRCGTSKATVCRCLKDDAELGRMCAAARDLYQQFRLADEESVSGELIC